MLKNFRSYVFGQALAYRRLLVQLLLLLTLLLSFAVTALPVFADPGGGGSVCIGC
jgi:hypothetical protein